MKPHSTSPRDQNINWSISIAINNLELTYKLSDDPILCYIYLDGSVVDVRSLGQELTKIHQINQYSQIKIEIKYSAEEIIGTVILNKDNLEIFKNNKFEQWFTFQEDISCSQDELMDKVLLEIEVKDNSVKQVQFLTLEESRNKLIKSNTTSQLNTQKQFVNKNADLDQDYFSSQNKNSPFQVQSSLLDSPIRNRSKLNIEQLQQFKQDKIQLLEVKLENLQDQIQLVDEGISSTIKQIKEISEHSNNLDVTPNQQRNHQLSLIIQDLNKLKKNREDLYSLKQQLESYINNFNYDQVSERKVKLEQIQKQNTGIYNGFLDEDKKQLVSPKKRREKELDKQKTELIDAVIKVRKDIDEKSLDIQLQEKADQIYNVLLKRQQEVEQECQEVQNKKMDNSLQVIHLEKVLMQEQQLTRDIQKSIEQKNKQAQFLKKELERLDLSIKVNEETYKSVIEQQEQFNQEKKQENQKIRQSIKIVAKEHEHLKSQLEKEKLKMNQLILERQSENQGINNTQIQIQNSSLDQLISGLKTKLKENQEALKTLIHIKDTLVNDLDESKLNKYLDSTYMEQIMQKKNIKYGQLQDVSNRQSSQEDKINQSLAFIQTKQYFHKQFFQNLKTLQEKESDLSQEQVNILQIIENLIKLKEEAKEKQDMQKEDAENFEKDLLEFQKEIQEQLKLESKKQQDLDSFIPNVETQNQLGDKIQQIRELEAMLRCKENEIDKLEVHQTKKDSVIIDMEFDYENYKPPVSSRQISMSDSRISLRSFKPDRIDEALSSYQYQHPLQVQFQRLGDGYYKFGSKKIYIKFEGQTLLVRTGPREYMTLNMFIIENEGIELQKVNKQD